MNRQEDEKFIRMAIRLAEQAREHGNQPFGALVVLDGEVIVQAESSSITSKDCTRHSELTVVSLLAQKDLDRQTLERCTLYSSTEPCAMCSGSIYWSGIGRLVFGCSNANLVRLQGDHMRIDSKDILACGPRKIEVVGPILEEEAIVSHNDYWKAPRTWWREESNATS